MASIQIKRGTRAQLDAAASASGLKVGELYLVTDESKLAVGLSVSTYQDCGLSNPVDNGVVINGVANFWQPTAPTLRVDGSALVDGDIWYQTGQKTWIRRGIYWIGPEKSIGINSKGFSWNNSVLSAPGDYRGNNVFGSPIIFYTKVEWYIAKLETTNESNNMTFTAGIFNPSQSTSFLSLFSIDLFLSFGSSVGFVSYSGSETFDVVDASNNIKYSTFGITTIELGSLRCAGSFNFYYHEVYVA